MNRRDFLGTLGALPLIPALTSAAPQPIPTSLDGLTVDEAGRIAARAVIALGLRESRRSSEDGYYAQVNLGMASPHPDRLHRKTMEKLVGCLVESIRSVEANEWQRMIVPYGVLRAGYIGPVRVVQIYEACYDRTLTRFDVGLLRDGVPVGSGPALNIVSRVWEP